MKKYTTIEDVVEQVVEVALHQWADEFDTSKIAREITEYQYGGLVVVVDGERFWDIVEQNELYPAE